MEGIATDHLDIKLNDELEFLSNKILDIISGNYIISQSDTLMNLDMGIDLSISSIKAQLNEYTLLR